MYPRNLTSEILNKLNSKEVIFLLGTRQTGKTTLTKLVSEASYFEKKQIFTFDFEDKEYRALFNLKNEGVKTLGNIFQIEGIDIGVKNLVIFDEIQLLDDPSNILKLIADHFPNIKIIATGSSSLQLKQKFTDSLAGRKSVFNVEPLCFDEFLTFKGEEKLLRLRELFSREKDKHSLQNLIESQHQNFISLLNEYLIYGGYPEVVLLQSKKDKVEKLSGIADSYIKKDIRDIAKIENIDAYNQLIKYLSINAGNLFNVSSASTAIGIATATLQKYLLLLKETFIIDELNPFFTNKNKEITKNKKIYFKDIGVRNLQIRNFNTLDLRTDTGILYENYVFNVLTKKHNILESIYFYRTQSKTEIDFITEKEGHLILTEVKSGKYSKKPKALSEFEKKYSTIFSDIQKLVINQSYFNFESDIQYIPAYLI